MAALCQGHLELVWPAVPYFLPRLQLGTGSREQQAGLILSTSIGTGCSNQMQLAQGHQLHIIAIIASSGNFSIHNPLHICVFHICHTYFGFEVLPHAINLQYTLYRSTCQECIIMQSLKPIYKELIKNLPHFEPLLQGAN